MNEFLQHIPIADAHHHLWDLGHGDYPWLSSRPNQDFFLGDYSSLRHNYLAADYRRDVGELNVCWTVHVEAEWDRSAQVAETQWVTEVARRHGMPGAIVAHAWFDAPNAEAILEAQAQFPLVRGIRSKPARPGQDPNDTDEARGAMDDSAWRRGYALLAKYNLSWDLRVPMQQLDAATRLITDFPDVPVVLNHTGFPWDRSDEGLAYWANALRTLAERPNVYIKLSEFGLPDAPWDYEQNRAIVLAAIDIFGADRAMFASNFPVAGLRISYQELFDAYKRMVEDFSEAELLGLFHDNAAAFYRPPNLADW
jgi:predicted TIM-barrel fold metal-dependent hydrolase